MTTTTTGDDDRGEGRRSVRSFVGGRQSETDGRCERERDCSNDDGDAGDGDGETERDGGARTTDDGEDGSCER